LGAYKDLAYALLTGIIAGFAFAKLKLPIPAPPSLAGILGIVGIFLGYLLAKR
jgi:XapX domain-containing protein